MSKVYGCWNFDEYVYHMIGSYRGELEGMTITDRRETSYLEALKYNAELIWKESSWAGSSPSPPRSLASNSLEMRRNWWVTGPR